MEEPIPFNRVYATGFEADFMVEAMRLGKLSGDGYFTERATARICEITGAAAALLTTSCTHALELAAILLDLMPGDEVIMPSFTFVSTANAFVLRGARPVFVDIKPGTNNIDEKLIEDAISPRTKAIVVVHYAGVGCEMDAISEIADRHGLQIIEDNAHGFGGMWRSKPLGSFGSMATLSFHETKNIQCGEGGAILFNDRRFLERAEILREKGTNRTRFFRGEIDKYTWVDIGSSYLPSELLAAFLSGQLAAFSEIQLLRTSAWSRYSTEIASWAQEQGFEIPDIPPHVNHPGHAFWMLAPSPGERSRFLDYLKSKSVGAVFHYVPLHSSPMGRRLDPDAYLPVTDDVSVRLIRLPLFPGITSAEIDRIVHVVCSFRSGVSL